MSSRIYVAAAVLGALSLLDNQYATVGTEAGGLECYMSR